MNLKSLQALVAEGESERLECKKTTGDLQGGMATLCGFLNGNGGQVLFGVTDGGRILGQDISDDTIRKVSGEITRIEPPVTITQTRVPVADSREVLVLETTVRSSSPYTYKGRAFRRIGSTTSLMPQAEYEQRLLERGHSHQRWENLPAAGYRIKDLDAREIRRTLREAVDAGRLESVVTGPKEALRKLNLLVDEVPSQAAVVAFAKNVEPDFPQCSLRMARFRGTTKTEFLDQRQLSGHAFQLLNEANLFLRRHLPVRGRFEPGVMERLDEPLFPSLALREALVNALCHRDYSIAGGAISIAVFDDRLEIASTGMLPFGITVDDLKREHTSKPRNPTLADVFFRRGLIERWGRGTLKIVELCRDAGHPDPVFEERAGEFVVRFVPREYFPPFRVSHDLTERQRRILHVLRDGEKRRRSEIRAQLKPKPPEDTLRDDLALLRSLGLVELKGHGRGAYWALRLGKQELGGIRRN